MKNLKDLKVIFFGTAEFAVPVLESLMEKTNVVAVVTQPDALVGRKQVLTKPPVLQEIEKSKNRENEKTSNPLIKQYLTLKLQTVTDELKALNADIFIVAAYGKIIPQAILDIPKYKTLNVHGSMLPKYRGASPIHFAILNGEKETGNTIMVVDAQMDYGPILAQSTVLIDDSDDMQKLYNKMSQDGAKLLIDTLPGYLDGSIQPQEQNHDMATLTKIITKEDGLIDWNKSSEQIINQWRAFKYWPGIYSFVADKSGNKIRIIFNEFAKYPVVTGGLTPLLAPMSQTGQVSFVGDRMFIGTSTESIEVLELTPEGKKTMKAKDFVNGYGWVAGQMLTNLQK